MNAKELHECVRLWPEGARDAELEWDDELDSWIAPAEAAFVSVDHAIALHVASGQCHLETIFESVTCRKGVEHEVVCRVFKSEQEITGVGPTKFHAIHAAIIATQGEKQ